jgi:hypothetical protein
VRGFSVPHPARVPSRSVGQRLWRVNYPLKQSVPTHRPDSVPSAGLLVILSPLVKKDPHHQQIHFSFPPGILSPPDRLWPSSPPRQRHSPPLQTKRPAIDNAIRRARTANLPRLAARRLSPAYRKKRPPPSPSFYGRVNNFETFPSLTGPAFQARRSASKANAASRCRREAEPTFSDFAKLSHPTRSASQDRDSRVGLLSEKSPESTLICAYICSNVADVVSTFVVTERCECPV